MTKQRRASLGTPTCAAGVIGKSMKRAPTQFRLQVLKLCSSIPEGKVSTYGAMAKALGSAARAIGQAMRNNPYAPTVPCHRVIASTLDLGGFGGEWGSECTLVKKKKCMLEAEGVKFRGTKVASPDYVVGPTELLRLSEDVDLQAVIRRHLQKP